MNLPTLFFPPFFSLFPLFFPRRSNVVLDNETTAASWFLTSMPREQVRWWAKQLLEAGPVGGYIVREPDSQKDSYALVVKVTATAIK